MIQPWDKVLVKIVAFDGKHKLSNKWGENSFNVQSLSNKDISVYTVRKEYPDELCIDIFHYRKDRNTALHNMKILTQITAGIRWWWMKQYPFGQSNDSTPVSLQRLEESHHHLNVHWPKKKVLKKKTIPVHLHLIIMCIIKVLQLLLF